jgi:hypothetical protein
LPTDRKIPAAFCFPVTHALRTVTYFVGGSMVYCTNSPGEVARSQKSMQLALRFTPATPAAYRAFA